MFAIVARHGGTVAKFIGDAIVAVFGVPTLHEDDALRAARCALELRDGRVGVPERLGLGLTVTSRAREWLVSTADTPERP